MVIKLLLELIFKKKIKNTRLLNHHRYLHQAHEEDNNSNNKEEGWIVLIPHLHKPPV